ncbi:MAG: hypothetical protein MRERV_40c002 [Mycoplasmataceae bacterium RV_VA103A]|nr:MAG: hypothetical protein MRERV_40c002 [Mycoplasmataceae bacterium RV_VA103A]
MESGSITSKDIIGWIVSVLISLIPLLIFYLNYQIYKKKSKEKIEILENMIYKLENEVLKKENEELKKQVKKLEEENKELKKKK